MYKLFLVLSLVLFVNGDEPILAWNESYKLTWNDFKAQPKQNASAVAITASGIIFGFSIRSSDSHVIDFNTEINAHFYPEQSWYKPEKANAHILKHEQLHFDITELHARKFRKRISELNISDTLPHELKAIQKTINKALEKFQNKYDTETNFSRNVETQLQWQRFINEELEKLDEFKSKK